jgi:amino acid permease
MDVSTQTLATHMLLSSLTSLIVMGHGLLTQGSLSMTEILWAKENAISLIALGQPPKRKAHLISSY